MLLDYKFQITGQNINSFFNSSVSLAPEHEDSLVQLLHPFIE
ncbi:hypothetical protein AWH56_26820 [Anaerobacillus isosaccharinicus]|uniref:Uncharacterized protein n=1 Tax=Anaerobacillus isosaccharinicus TaxID=1532552 RepID=A0AC62A4H0_9BACI